MDNRIETRQNICEMSSNPGRARKATVDLSKEVRQEMLSVERNERNEYGCLETVSKSSVQWLKE